MSKLSPETLNLTSLSDAVAQKVFEQGQSLFRLGRVEIEEVTDFIALCKVQDYRQFDVKISVSSNYLYMRCDCPYGVRGSICAHDVAAFLAVRARLSESGLPDWEVRLDRLMQVTNQEPRVLRRTRPYLLFFSLHKSITGLSIYGGTSWTITPYTLAAYSLPAGWRSAEALEDLQAVMHYIEDAADVAGQVRAAQHGLDPTCCLNAIPESVSLTNLLLDRGRLPAYTYGASSRSPLPDYLALIAATGSPLFLGSKDNPLKLSLTVHPGLSRMHLDARRESDGVHLRPRLISNQADFFLEPGSKVISNYPLWILTGRNLFQVEEAQTGMVEMLLQEQEEIIIPSTEENDFLEKKYPQLVESLPLEGNLIQRYQVGGEPTGRLYLQERSGKLVVELRFAYEKHEVACETEPPEASIIPGTNAWSLIEVRRQPEREAELHKSLSSSTFRLKYGPKNSPHGEFLLRARAHPIDFLMYSVPHLLEAGYEVYGEEKLSNLRVNRARPTISFNISSGIDWFDVQADVYFGDQSLPLKDLRRYLRKQQRYVKLADGTVGEIPPDWLEKYKVLFALGENRGDGLRLGAHHIGLLDELLDDARQAHTDAEFEQRRQMLRDFQGVQPQALPAGFQGELRPYQKAGYDWLHFLYDYHFGGCLADDMGLGKTVQALAFFQSIQESQPAAAAENGSCPASLLVVPRSLLINWQREAERFTPNLRLLEYFDSDRTEDIQLFNEYDLVVTTYGIMRRDIERLRQYEFHCVLLDESQAIKNPISKTARAARMLHARHRLALTGTPVENNTLELWSLFAFLNPGLLGSLDFFKSEFVLPIEKKNDSKAADKLRRLVYPFILRRTKTQVAPELPPRTERILYCDMEPAQRNLYNRTRENYRTLLMGMLEQEGLQASRMKILEGLLRLRQICNHPLLVDKKFRGASGKFDLLLETLETLRSEGHKALVFSQFVSMLSIVRQTLDERQMPYAYLDGSTRDRQGEVDRFQSNPALPFFLISLKAGGLGLNLTAADYVIHIDPWWNPAVELQATDRTHRIGQDKPVFVYKLIARDSVEEKILKLQEQKRKLVDQLISSESGVFKNLTTEDVEVLFGY